MAQGPGEPCCVCPMPGQLQRPCTVLQRVQVLESSKHLCFDAGWISLSTRQWAASCASGTALCANTVVIPTGSNSTTAKRQWQESPSCSALCQTTSTQIFAVRCCNLMASKPVTLQATKKEVPEPNFYPDSMTLTAQTLTCPRPDKSQRTTECQVL